MDPDELLGMLRDALADAKVAAAGDSNDDEIVAWQQVGEYFTDLDEWLMKGGYLPRPWQEAARRTVTKINRETWANQPRRGV